MAPTTRSSRGSSPTKVGFEEISKRITRARSLPGARTQSLVIVPSETITRFDLGQVIPSSVVICKACKTPIVKTPKTPPWVRTPLAEQIELYLTEARNRNTAIQAAYASASKDFKTLGNQDISGEHSPIRVAVYRHVPYTVDACEKVGNVMGALGRALDSSLKSVAALEKVLEAERTRPNPDDPEEENSRAKWEEEWWKKEKKERLAEADRLEAARMKKKRKRAKKQSYINIAAMAGSIGYVSFPRFTRRRRFLPSGLVAICFSFTNTFLGLRKIIDNLQPGRCKPTMPSSPEASGDRLRSWLRRCKSARTEHVDRSTKKCEKSSTQRILSSTDDPADCNLVASKPTTSNASSSTSFRTRIARQLWSPNRSKSQGIVPSAGESSNADLSAPLRIPELQYDSLIADLDALSLSEAEWETLKRMEQVCHAATVAQARRRHHRPAICSHDSDLRNYNPANFAHLHLRGGGDAEEAIPQPFRGPRRRTTLPYTPPAEPLSDDYRPNAAVWWLAGGQTSQNGRVSTLGELRVRKEVEMANRGIVGFLGTVLGLRRVGRVGILHENDGAGKDGQMDGASLGAGTPERADGGVDDAAVAEDAARADSVAGSVRSVGKDGNEAGGGLGEGVDMPDAASSVRSTGKKSSHRPGAANEANSLRSGGEASEKADDGGKGADGDGTASPANAGEGEKGEKGEGAGETGVPGNEAGS
ncbi:hypothetical protein Q7P37_001602 [Cladosporium fusiforme]